MAQQTKEQRLADVHARAMSRFDAIQAALRDERRQCLEDRRFYSIAGAQWEGPLGDQFENKPRFELNKVHLAVIRVINEYRNNRITVDFQPKDGSDDDKLADTCDGLYRADEQDSGAQEAYDNGFEEGVGGGFGAWRLRACYEDDEDDDDDRQRIRMEPIFDADSCVFFDLDAKRQDKADAKFCFVLTSMTPEAYQDEYGDDPASWPAPMMERIFDWATPDVVYIAEYYEVEQKSELIHIYRGLALNSGDEPNEIRVPDSELKADPDKEPTLLATGFRKVREKRVTRRKIHKYQLSGARVEEDEGYIAGRCIPIIPVYGKRWVVDGIERCMGHVRLAKDAQRLTNMLMSWLAEMAARFDIEKPILTPEQIAGHATMWAEDNVKKFPYLLINPITDPTGQQVASGPIGYTRAPSLSPAMAALMQLAEQALQDLLGNQQAGEEVQPNISGKVVELIQNRLDMQAFIYMDNMRKAVKRSGEVWMSMAKDIFVEEGRTLKTIGADGKAGNIELLKPTYNKETGETELENDLSKAKFEVVADVGPTSSSRRAATVRSLVSVLQMITDPNDQKVITSMIMMNMEGEGLSDVRDYFRQQLLRIGAIKPTEEEAQELEAEKANTPPDPQAQYLQAAAQEAVAKGEKARADTVKTLADAEKARAETVKTMSEVTTEAQNRAIDAAQAIRDAITPPAPSN